MKDHGDGFASDGDDVDASEAVRAALSGFAEDPVASSTNNIGIATEDTESIDTPTENSSNGLRSDDNEQDKEKEVVELDVPELSEEQRKQKIEEALVKKDQGNNLFKEKDFEKALEMYGEALGICPAGAEESAAMYGNRAACHSKLENFKECIEDCTEALKINPDYVKVMYRRAVANEELEKYDEALEDCKRVIELQPSHRDAAYAVKRLGPLAEQQREKMKDEMFGKLRELGDMCLKPFGLSTNNFQMVQDPNTGSYSVNFQQG